MLTKPLSHLRPLLRLPSHTHTTHTQPDHFTANPSLPHHLPRHSKTHALAIPGAAHAAGHGRGQKGAGQGRGYGRDGAGSGYTGHARAFLALPQASQVDPNAGLSTDDPEVSVLRHEIGELATGIRRSPRLLSPASLPGHGPALRKSFSIRRIQEHTTLQSASTRHVPQANRILMDLAGRDIPRRHNSTVAHRSWTDDIVIPTASSRPLSSQELQDQERDFRIYQAIKGAVDHRQLSHFHALVQHYRSSRVLAPFDERLAPGEPSLSGRFPLPSNWTVNTYNVILQGLNQSRLDGESVAQALEIYNEMLERDVLPNGRTYAAVIQALSLRERDVWTAVDRWDLERSWLQWREQSLGIPIDNDMSDNRRDLIQGYIAEGNMISALRLFRAAVTFHNTSGWKFMPETYFAVLQALSVQRSPDLTAVDHVFDHAYKRSVTGWRSLSRFVFTAYAKRGGPLTEAWEAFEQHIRDVTSGKATFKLRDWVSRYEPTDDVVNQALARGQLRDAYESAISAFISIGNVDLARTILESANQLSLLGERHSSLYSAYLVALARHDPSFAVSEYKRLQGEITTDTPLGRLPLSDILVLVDLFVPAGHWRLALDLLRTGADAQVDHKPDQVGATAPASWLHTRSAAARLRKVYIGLLANASSDPNVLDLPAELLQSQSTVTAPVIKIAFDLLAENGLYHLAGRHARLFNHGEMSPSTVQVYNSFLDKAVDALPLHEALKTYRFFSAIPHVHLPDHGKRFLQKYDAERPKLSSSTWTTLLLNITRRHVQDGEHDETLEHIFSAYRTDGANLGEILLVLRERFGPDRMEQMANVAFGDKAAEHIKEANDVWRRESLQTFQVPAALSQTALPASQYVTDAALTTAVDALLRQTIGNAQRQSTNAHQAYDLIAQAFTEGKMCNMLSIARVIGNLRRPGDESAVQHLYDIAQAGVSSWQGRPSSRAIAWRTIEDGMIIACCHLGRLEQAGAHRARIIEAGMTPSPDAYATMIASSKDTTDDALVAREMFDESQRLGVKPNLYLYNTIISKLSKARKVELALELFAHMKAAGIQPSSVTYGAVMNACTRVGDAQSAENLFEEMRLQPNFRPRVPPFNTMIQLYVQTTPNREKALHYYGMLRAAGVPPSAHTYKLLLDLHVTLAPFDLAAAQRVFDEIKADPSVPVQGSHFASLITGHGIYAEDMPTALAIFDSVPSDMREAVVWEAILNVIAHRGTLPQLIQMRERMETENVRPTAYIYNVLITGYSRGGDMEMARSLFESMGDSISGVAAPNNHPVLHTSTGLPKPSTISDVDQVFREPSTYEAMIRAEMKTGNVVGAQDILARMEQRGYPWAVVARVRALLE